MAIYDTGTSSLAANGTVTGVGTAWKAPLTLIRVGATIIFKTSPLKIYTISEIISDTQINVYNPNSEVVPAGTGYAILAHDGITVQGLAQDVAETLRYYQSRETSIESLLQFIGQDNFDWPRFERLAIQSTTGAAEALASQIAAAESASTAVGASNNAQNSYNRTVEAINAAGNTAAVAYFANHGIGSTKTPLLTSLNWQTMQFYSGGSYQCTIANMVNIPAALSSMFPDTNTTICIDVLATMGVNGSNVLRLSPSTGSNSNFRIADVTISGATGSRVFYVREVISLPGGDAATGGSSAQRVRGLLDVYSKSETFKKSLNFSDVKNKSTARTNLGLGDASNVKHGTLRLTGGESLALNAIESNETSISNTPLGADNWVGQTTHRFYNDFSRSGLVRDGGANLSDYRIQVFRSGDSEALYRFMPNNRIISGNSDNTSVSEFQKAPLSDRDIKKEIKYTDGEESYNRVRQWLPAMFKYNGSDVQRYGLIAQDLVNIDPEYVHLIPGCAIYKEVKGLNEEGNEIVIERNEVGYTDDTLSLDSNVLLMDLCSAFVYESNKVLRLEKEVEELKGIVSTLISK